MSVCCSKIPSICPRHLALCTPDSTRSSAGKPIVRPCSLTHSLGHLPTFLCSYWFSHLAWRALVISTFGQACSLHCRSTGNVPPSITVALFGLGLNGSPVNLSSSLLHLANSGCRLIVRNLRTRVRALQCVPVLPSQTNSNQFTS